MRCHYFKILISCIISLFIVSSLSMKLKAQVIIQNGDHIVLTANVSSTINDGASNVVIDGNGNTVAGVATGIELSSDVTNVTIENFNIYNCTVGIELNEASNITVVNNIINDSWAPVYAEGWTAGVDARNCSNNTITQNNFTSDVNAISLALASRNIIFGNNFTKCSAALILSYSSNNIIYHNNFFNNEYILVDEGYVDGSVLTDGYGVSVNNWDNGYPGGGNNSD